MSKNINKIYRYSDLAEIVHNPSLITRKYLDIWFTGKSSFGLALAKIGWPYAEDSHPLLKWDKIKGLKVDILVEERVMYSKTIYHYKNINGSYVLTIDFRKININTILSTFQAIWAQSKLLINNQQTYNRAKSYVEEIPLITSNEQEQIEKILHDIVWPNLIAVDYIGEYIVFILLNNKKPEEQTEILSRIHNRVRDIDWYTHAILAWDNYKQGKISKSELIEKYGYVAGDDYELTRPRYYELLKQDKPKITKLEIKNMEIHSLEDLAVGMHYLRSEAKRRSLIWIDALRQALIKNRVIHSFK